MSNGNCTRVIVVCSSPEAKTLSESEPVETGIKLCSQAILVCTGLSEPVHLILSLFLRKQFMCFRAVSVLVKWFNCVQCVNCVLLYRTFVLSLKQGYIWEQIPPKRNKYTTNTFYEVQNYLGHTWLRKTTLFTLYTHLQ